jgi:hypothetical protein
MSDDPDYEPGDNIAQAIRKAADLLGNGAAATPMGAIEAFGVVVNEASIRIASNLGDIADAIEKLAVAVKSVANSMPE